jgi:hypothetical protein
VETLWHNARREGRVSRIGRVLGASAVLLMLAGTDVALADTASFSYSGAEQSWIVPTGVTSIHVVAIGGKGGAGDESQPGAIGGFGAMASGDIAVTPGQTLFVEVGGNGATATNGSSGAPGAGGFNGGAVGGVGDAGVNDDGGGGGGGASDVRTTPSASGGSAGSRLLVAGGGGGGGGGGQTATGGRGGAAGQNGTAGVNSGNCTAGGGGTAGTATSGGAGGAAGTSDEGAAPGVASNGPAGGPGGGPGAFGGGGGGGGGLNGGGGGGSGGFSDIDTHSCAAGGGGGGFTGFATTVTGAALAGDTTGVPSVTFTYTVAAPAGPTPPPGGTDPGPATDTTKPVIKTFVLSPTSFVAANVGSSTARASAVGGKVVYQLSEKSVVTFTVFRRASGVRLRGRGACRARPRGKLPKSTKSCTRYVKVKGSFVQAGGEGFNTFRFMGRLRNRALPVGRYRLYALAVDGAGNRSKVAYRAFRIKTR